MSNLPCVTVRFLRPHYHGRADGDEPEWPPSWLRLFQALVAAAANRGRNGSLDENFIESLRWFEQRLKLSLKRRLAEHYRHYANALQNVHEYETIILPEAQKAYRTNLQSYHENRVAWSDVLETQKEYFDLRFEYVRHLLRWRESEVAIKGYLLVDGLKAPTGPRPPGHIDAVHKPR